MTDQEEEALRGLLYNRNITFPALVFGMLGGDPNAMTLEQQVLISGWLQELGYERRPRPWFRHAHCMSAWVREEMWPGETGGRMDYEGIPLRPDPDLVETDEEREERLEGLERLRRYIGEL